MTGNDHARRGSRRLWLLLVPLLAIGGWFAVSAVSYGTSLRLYSIPSASMAPTLAIGDRVAVETGRRSLPRRGEVWVFNSPGGGLTFVKRVVGLPGETVQVEDGRVTIDGVPLSEPYLSGPISYTMPPRRLSPGRLLHAGRQPHAQHDSHVWGPVPERELIGRVRYRYWPRARLGSLD